MPQFFQLSLGATWLEQATRTEVVSFSLSLKELKQWNEIRDETYCPRNENGLRGRLGLKEWVDSALYPYDMRDLQLGKHPSPAKVPEMPKTVSGPTPKGGGGPSNALALAPVISSIKDRYLTLVEMSKAINHREQDIIDKIHEYRKHADAIDPATLKKIENYRGFYEISSSRISIATEKIKACMDEIIVVADKGFAVGDAVSKATNCLHEAEKFEVQGAQVLEKIQSFLSFKPDPPLDGLLHSVQFVVTRGASVSPNWSFLVWKGPSVTSPGALAAGQRTHILNLALGTPGEQNRLIQNQTVLSAPKL